MAVDEPGQMVAMSFDGVLLDPDNARLSLDGVRIDLPPKAFAVLCQLAWRPGQLVTKEELLDAVWGRRFVSESVLKTAVNAIRSALHDDPRQPRFIETVSRRGYRFVAVLAAPVEAPLAAPLWTMPAGAPWVGRQDVLARLEGWIAALATGSRNLVLMGGEVGVGKTALIDRCCARVVASKLRLASGQCVEQLGGAEPFLPLLDALAMLARGLEGPAWVQALRRYAPAWYEQLPGLSAVADEPQGRPIDQGPQRMLREFGGLLDAMTADRPLVLVIEDLHWADHATVDLLGYLARRRGPARWLIIASYRSIEAALADHPLQAMRQELRAQRLCEEVLLDAFTELEADDFLRQRFAPAVVERRADLARALHAHTEGLPLFVVAVIDELLAGGGLRSSGDHWQVGDEVWSALGIPETVAGLIERQIARLPTDRQTLLEAASVLGSEFASDALAALLNASERDLVERLDALSRGSGWLAAVGMTERAGGRLAFRYTFRHALHHRVLYVRTTPAQRLNYHLAAAQALRGITAEPERHAAELAYHFERACDIAAATGSGLSSLAGEARCWRIAAARQASALHAVADAVDHYQRALAGEPPPAERVRLLIEVSELLRLSGRGSDALEAGGQALVYARQSGDQALLSEARLHQARLCARCDRAAEGLALIDEWLKDESLSPSRRADGLLVQAEGYRRSGAGAQADEALRLALAVLPAEAVAARAAILAEQVDRHFESGSLAEGLKVADEARALFDQCGDLVGAARVQLRKGVLCMNLNRAAEAETALLEARERMRAQHDVDGQRRALLNLVKMYSDDGDADTALALLQEGWSLASTFESPVAECAFLNGFYYCNYLRGDLGAAWTAAERVLDSARPLSSLYWRVGSIVVVTDLYCHLGEWSRAGELVDAALAQLADSGEQVMRARALVRRAWLDQLTGEPARALERIDALLAEGPVEHAEDAAGLARVRAQALLDLGQPEAALAVLADYDGAPTREVWAQMLAQRLQIGVALGHAVAADVERARQEVGDRRLPALEGLILSRRLVATLNALGERDEAVALGRSHDATRTRLAVSLEAWPAVRDSFLRRFPAST